MHTFKYFRCTCLNPKLWPQPYVIRGTCLFWKLYFHFHAKYVLQTLHLLCFCLFRVETPHHILRMKSNGPYLKVKFIHRKHYWNSILIFSGGSWHLIAWKKHWDQLIFIFVCFSIRPNWILHNIKIRVGMFSTELEYKYWV